MLLTKSTNPKYNSRPVPDDHHPPSSPTNGNSNLTIDAITITHPHDEMSLEDFDARFGQSQSQIPEHTRAHNPKMGKLGEGGRHIVEVVTWHEQYDKNMII